VCWNIALSKSVVTVQRAFRAKYAKDPPTDKTVRAWYKQFTETGCLCKQKSSRRPLTAEELECRIDVFRVTRVAHIEHLWLKKIFFFHFSRGCEQFHQVRSFGFLVINVCNREEHYETPCIYWSSCDVPVILVKISIKPVFSAQIFEKLLKFHENPCSGSRAVPCGRTDRRADIHKEANSRLSQYC